jgi:DNA (cytosine-5)-methyltransferase 1
MYIRYEGENMNVSYKRLWKLLENKNMKKQDLRVLSRISTNALAKLGKDENISTEILSKICMVLNCEIEDIMEFEKAVFQQSKRVANNDKKFKVIELFAGAGGLALGIEKADFEPLGLIEFDKSAVDTLKFNRKSWNVIHADIANISCLDLEEYFSIKSGELDLLSGGAPCQSFSYAGKRLGLDDARGTLFYHYAVFLQKLQPQMFLFENVKGLLTHDNGNTYNTMVKIFEDSGYTIQKSVLNAWDYGVAQKRERLITIGVRNDLVNKVNFQFPTPHSYKPVLRDILNDVPKSVSSEYSHHKKKIFDLVPQGGYWRDVPEEIAKEYMKSCWYMKGGRTGILRRLSMDEPSLTVLTSPSQKQTERCHPLESRPLTVRENARCQSFPDEWVFCGSVGEQYKQVGNAVPVNLAYEIAIKIKEGLACL